jgi:hypothetical protein
MGHPDQAESTTALQAAVAGPGDCSAVAIFPLMVSRLLKSWERFASMSYGMGGLAKSMGKGRVHPAEGGRETADNDLD